MAITETLARDNVLAINTGSTETPVWTDIEGLKSVNVAFSKTDANTRHMSDGGWQKHLPAARGVVWTLTGVRQSDPDDGSRDPGQEELELYNSLIGPEGIAGFQLTLDDGEVITFDASVVVTPFGGGGEDDPNQFSATLTQTGQASSTAAVAAPAIVTSVAGTTDDTVSLITWTNGTGSPDAFEIRSRVAGVTITTHHSTGQEAFYFPGLTNGTAYTFQVRARNAGGWGPWSTASSAVTPTA